MKRNSYKRFILSCEGGPAQFRLCPNSEFSHYSTCFAIFGMKLLNCSPWLESNKGELLSNLLEHLDYINSQLVGDISEKLNKGTLQYVCFAFSSLSILGEERQSVAYEISKKVVESIQVKDYLTRCGALEGTPGSGNSAMFYAIFLAYLQKYFNYDAGSKIDEWFELHKKYMNRHGFWGNPDKSHYLQFQNGYHQYEIFEYFGEPVPRLAEAKELILALMGNDYHFAPYPGGGGCYDYDAVFILTMNGPEIDPAILRKIVDTISGEQNINGGFAENCSVNTLSISFLFNSFFNIMLSQKEFRHEKLRRTISCLRPKNYRMHTHWTKYSRKWSEANLWDSWFRTLLIARASVALEPKAASEWGFIDCPGIGFNRQALKFEDQ